MAEGNYVGYLIYSGIMPLLKTFITIFLGWILAWKGLFTPAASKGTSQLTMNIALPCLIFSNIVPAFTPQNVSALGPLFLLSFFYIFVGLIFGIIIREFCFVPRNFWYGIIVATALSNWGNLPNSIVLSVTQNAPFDPSTDPALGVSYVSVFTVSANAMFWVFGANAITWDYRPDVPQGHEEAYRRVSWKEKPLGRYLTRILRTSRKKPLGEKATVEPCTPEDLVVPSDTEKDVSTLLEMGNPLQLNADTFLAEQVASRLSTHSFRSRRLSSQLPHPASSPAAVFSSNATLTAGTEQQPSASALKSAGISRYIPTIVINVCVTVWGVINPITSSMIIALPIALVPPLKALFVDATASGGPSFTGPDGNPPLAFIQDTAVFVGDVTVPLSLVLLGASFARMRRPSNISRLPLPAIFAVTITKLVILPVCGIFLVQGLVTRGMIPTESRAERFVGILLSGTPSMVNQVIVAQLCSPDGDISTLSAFLLVQYVCMFLSSAAITAISLALIK